MKAHRLPIFLLVAGDAAGFFLALALTMLVRYGTLPFDGGDIWQTHMYAFTPIFALWLLVLSFVGLYEPRTFADHSGWWRTLLAGAAINFALAVFVFYFLPFWSIAPKTNLFLVLAFSALFLLLWRRALVGFWHSPRWRVSAALVGTREEVDLFLRDVEHHAAGFRIKALLVVEEASEDIIAQFPGYAASQNIEMLMITEGTRTRPETLEIASRCLLKGIDILDATSVTEYMTKKVPLRFLSTIWVLEHFIGARHRFADFIKRFLDIAGVLVASAILLPVAPAIVLIVRMIDGGPVLYRQARVGKDGRVFVLRKFRTMRVDAELGGVPRWAESGDARITRLGRVLRLTHLDELPQLWNIFIGEMSFVGPRPERPEFSALLEVRVPFYALRHLVRPGLTGWAQINYPYAGSIDESIAKLEYDLYYIKNRSLWLDLTILFRTSRVLLGLGPR